MAKNRKGGKKKKTNPNHTPLAQHKRVGQKLIPPLADIPNLHLSSWYGERVPELLWALLIHEVLGRNNALDCFRAVARLSSGRIDAFRSADITHSAIAAFPQDWRGEVLDVICGPEPAKRALRPLLLLDGLPGRDEWASRLGTPLTGDEGWSILGRALAGAVDHQSERATDCRWARVLFAMLVGKLHLPNQEMIEEIFYFPNRGDLREVRPTIRSTEGSFSGLFDSASDWPEAFWDECMKKTECTEVDLWKLGATVSAPTTLERMEGVHRELRRHFRTTTVTTALDTRREAIFGIAAYCLQLCRDAIHIGNSTSIIGRLALRSALEAVISLAYLLKKDDKTIWGRYRNFGSGQAKLAFLKLTDVEQAARPAFVSVEELSTLANEDFWLEFREINIGHWAATDLRKMSEEAGLKDLYDSYYPWPSAFVHANWAAVRRAVMGQCINPLHRFHRPVAESDRNLDDVFADLCGLADRALALLDLAYPSFPERLTAASNAAPVVSST